MSSLHCCIQEESQHDDLYTIDTLKYWFNICMSLRHFAEFGPIMLSIQPLATEQVNSKTAKLSSDALGVSGKAESAPASAGGASVSKKFSQVLDKAGENQAELGESSKVGSTELDTGLLVDVIVPGDGSPLPTTDLEECVEESAADSSSDVSGDMAPDSFVQMLNQDDSLSTVSSTFKHLKELDSTTRSDSLSNIQNSMGDKDGDLKSLMSDGQALLSRLTASHAQLSNTEGVALVDAEFPDTLSSDGKDLPQTLSVGKATGQKNAEKLTVFDSSLQTDLLKKSAGGGAGDKSSLVAGSDDKQMALLSDAFKVPHHDEASSNLLQADSNVEDKAMQHKNISNIQMLTNNKSENLSAGSQQTLTLSKEQAGEKLAEQVHMMMSKNLKQIDIRLDPPELGKLHIKLSMNNDQASVQFTVANTQTRDLIEHAMPRLRDLMVQQGVQLAQGSVQQDAQSAGQFQQQSQSHNGSTQSSFASAEHDLPAEGEVSELWVNVKAQDGVDFYA